MRIRRIALATAAGSCLAACTGSPATPETDHATTTMTASPAAPTPTATVDAQRLLPSNCGTLLTISAVRRALNRGVFGTHYLREKPLPSGRLGRVTCTWPTHVRTRDQQVPAQFSATVNLYPDHDTVRHRMRLTLATDTANGNRISDVTVADRAATLDADTQRTTLLVPLDVRVLVLQVDHATVGAARAPAALESLAAIALRSLPAR